MTGMLDRSLGPLADALQVRGYRQQLLAANIANADTPNYKAVDLNFAKTLQAVEAGKGGGLPLQTNALRQPPGAAADLGLAAAVEYQRGNQVGLDGNSVDMNREQASFLQNSVQYQADLTFITGKIKILLSAVTGTSV
ncbi:flagellar basal body rod protein FlgB [Acidithiobacillus sulfuriphilus]|uniref:flagellar basal body rod protein FlgB n=1 Tax=Acidithiobacillus sulfuriphilus TaxID=1867749 RepID=UPI003F640736